MQSSLVKAYRFFKANAGYIVGQASQFALQMARAEIAARNTDVIYTWGFDDYCDDSFVDTWDNTGKARKQWDAQDHACEYCDLHDADGNLLASLCGIWDASADYRRVVQAELALEAIDAIEGIGAGL